MYSNEELRNFYIKCKNEYEVNCVKDLFHRRGMRWNTGKLYSEKSYRPFDENFKFYYFRPFNEYSKSDIDFAIGDNVVSFKILRRNIRIEELLT
mgnify:CR=1 FL=1